MNHTVEIDWQQIESIIERYNRDGEIRCEGKFDLQRGHIL